jgi:hypothetical protein
VSNAKQYQIKAKTNKQHLFLAGQPCILGGSLHPDDKFSSESHFFIYPKFITSITSSDQLWINKKVTFRRECVIGIKATPPNTGLAYQDKMLFVCFGLHLVWFGIAHTQLGARSPKQPVFSFGFQLIPTSYG